ncbi:hypothetical protein K458DRAFT_397090 [Lentithecium fluviatile CBS 122367]|uniref:2EXR domain-containing protein n=1 Tax=Lentithecium fluviatile CBS 122367 TaxID=1168545 RepID=A0A6G1IE32_9PLEO|nr:hypothetical protein K458DRAFT_397090 [Lentithecium fluviatile CBS 122367]
MAFSLLPPAAVNAVAIATTVHRAEPLPRPATFPRFSHLPAELQVSIIHYACEVSLAKPASVVTLSLSLSPYRHHRHPVLTASPSGVHQVSRLFRQEALRYYHRHPPPKLSTNIYDKHREFLTFHPSQQILEIVVTDWNPIAAAYEGMLRRVPSRMRKKVRFLHLHIDLRRISFTGCSLLKRIDRLEVVTVVLEKMQVLVWDDMEGCYGCVMGKKARMYVTEQNLCGKREWRRMRMGHGSREAGGPCTW